MMFWVGVAVGFVVGGLAVTLFFGWLLNIRHGRGGH
jgi:hypothetical protein